MGSHQSDDSHREASVRAGERCRAPMNQQVELDYRMHRVLTNLNRLDVDRLDDADQERVETARDLLEEVSLLTQPEGEDGTDVRADA